MLFALYCLLFIRQGEEPKIDEQLNVVAKEIVVRVQDAEAGPIRGLRKQDFELSVNGTELENFEFREMDLEPRQAGDVDTTTTPSSAEPTEDSGSAATHSGPREQQVSKTAVRNTALVVDTAYLTPKGLDTLRQVAVRAANELPVGDRIALFHVDRQMVQLTPFTDNRQQLVSEIEKLEASAWLLLEERTLRQRIEGTKRNFQNLQNMRMTGGISGGDDGSNVEGDNDNGSSSGQSSSSTGSSSRRSSSYSMELDFLERMFENLERLHESAAKNYIFFMDAVSRRLEPMPGEKSMMVLTGGRLLQEQNNKAFSDLVSTLNGRNVALNHMVFGDPDSNIGKSNTFMESIESFMDSPEMRKNLSKVSEIDTLERRMSLANIQATPARLSNATGGAYVSTENTFGARGAVFDRFMEQNNHYYVLTYYSPSDLDKIDVRLPRNRDAKVFYGERRNYKENDAALIPEDMDFESRLLMGGPETTYPATWGHFVFRNQEGKWAVPVFGEMQLADLPSDGIEVGFIAMNDKGDVLAKKITGLNFPKKPETLTAYDVLITDEKPASVRYYFRDPKEGKGNLMDEVIESPGVADEPMVSSIVMFRPQPAPLALYKVRSEDKERVPELEKEDPFVNDQGQRISFPSQAIFDKNGQIFVLFNIYNAPGGLQQYGVGIELYKGTEKPQLQMATLELTETTPGRHRFVGAIDPSALSPGDYRLQVNLKDPKSGEVQGYSSSFTLR